MMFNTFAIMTSVLAMTTLAMPNDLVVRKRQEESQ